MSGVGVVDVSFTNVGFAHGHYSRPNSDLGYVEQQSGALVSRPGTQCNDTQWEAAASHVEFKGRSARVSFVGSRFERMGGGALELSGGAQDCVVSHCGFEDLSGAAVQLGGSQGSTRATRETEPSSRSRCWDE